MTSKINLTELLADREAGTGGEWKARWNDIYWDINSETHGQIGDCCASNTIYVDGEPLARELARQALALAGARALQTLQKGQVVVKVRVDPQRALFETTAGFGL